MIPFAYNLRSLLVRRATTAAAAIGLGLVVFLLAAVMMLTHGVAEATRHSSDPKAAIVLRSGSGAEIESRLGVAQVSKIFAAPHIARAVTGRPLAVAELIVLAVAESAVGTGISNVQIRGVPDDVLSFRPGVRIITGRAAKPGTREAIVGKAIAGRFKGLALGGVLTLRQQRELAIVGVFEDAGSTFESEVWADTSLLQDTFGQKATVSSVRVRLSSEAAFEGFRAAIEGDREGGLQALREAEFAHTQTQGTTTFVAALGGMIAVLFAVAAILGAMITLHTTVAERRREIGTLRALGFSRMQVLGSFLIEAVVLALAGGALGLVAALLLSFKHVSMVNTATWAELSFRFEPSASVIAASVIGAALMGVLGGLLPALRATAVPAAQALRGG